MKAWRLDAPNVNLRREMGSKEPTARVQKVQRELPASTAPSYSSNWLLAGLLQRAGILAPDTSHTLSHIPETPGSIKRMYRKAIAHVAKCYSLSRP